MKITSDVLLAKIAKVYGSGTWTWVYDIVVDEDLATLTRPLFRLTPYSYNIVVGAVTYNPAPISFRAVSASADSSVPTLEISIDNRLRIVGSYIEQGAGFRGKLVQVGLVNLEELGEGIAATVRGTIQTITLSRDEESSSVVIAAQLANTHEVLLPRQTYDAHVCQHVEFGGPFCGFVVTASTPEEFRSCNRSFAACVDHGVYAATANIPVRHPARFGAQPGLGVERAIRGGA